MRRAELKIFRDLLEEHRKDAHHEDLCKLCGAAERVLSSVSRKSVKSAPRRKEKKAKRLTKKEETAAIREAVRERSGGGCELCPDLGTELHHALGRVRAKQDPSNCLWLCRACHHAITINSPSAAYWLDAQARRFVELRCHGTAQVLESRLEFAKARGAA